MSEDHPPLWLLLSNAKLYLGKRGGYAYASERLKSAVLSRIPVRGCLDGGERVPQRFDHLMQPDAKIDILDNEVRIPRGPSPTTGSMLAMSRPDQRWEYVEIDRLALDEFLAKNYGVSPPVPATLPMPSKASLLGSRGVPHAVKVKRKRRRPGPRPGTVDRFGAEDRALFPRIGELVSKGESITGAATKLADEGVVAGHGEPTSRARRLAKRYRADQPTLSHSLPLAPTNSGDK